MRRLVAEGGFANAKYVSGLSGDLVHPNVKGVNAIANNIIPIAMEWFK